MSPAPSLEPHVVPQPVLDYGPPTPGRPIGMTLAYLFGASLFGAGAGLAACGLLSAIAGRSYNDVPLFAAVGGLGVCLLLWGLFTLALVIYLRLGTKGR